MHFELKLGWQYLLSRRSKMLTQVSLITILGIGFGVMALMVTLAIMDGFQEEYKRSVLAFNAHALVMQGDSIQNVDELIQTIEQVARPGELKGLSPFIFREGLAVKGNRIRGLAIKVVELDNYWQLSHLPHEGFGDSEGLWLGKTLMAELGRKGNAIRLRLPATDTSQVTFRELPVQGTFSSGMYDYDSSFALIDRREAEQWLGENQAVNGIEIWLQDADKSIDFTSRLSDILSFPYTVLSWQDLNAHLFGALKLERLVFSLIMGILIMVASFNISGTLTMRILDKRGDIAILRAMGATWGQLRRLFFIQGLALGWLGCVLGLVLGLAIVEFLIRFRPMGLDAEIYFVEFVPAYWKWSHIALVLAVATFFAWISSRLALVRLEKMSIVEALGDI